MIKFILGAVLAAGVVVAYYNPKETASYAKQGLDKASAWVGETAKSGVDAADKKLDQAQASNKK
jgi:hypothetical protein